LHNYRYMYYDNMMSVAILNTFCINISKSFKIDAH
jgi:hypothetical protein